jgi:glutamate dehydrogenase (NAD(P)+)
MSVRHLDSAARGRVADNVRRLRAKLVVKAPTFRRAQRPAIATSAASWHWFIANAGGVICAAVEYRGGTETAAFEEVNERIRRNTRDVLRVSAERKVTPRAAAESLAGERIRRAMSFRRWTSPNLPGRA